MFEYRDRCVQTAHSVHLYTPGYKDTAYTCTHLDTRQDGFHRFTHTYLCTLNYILTTIVMTMIFMMIMMIKTVLDDKE